MTCPTAAATLSWQENFAFREETTALRRCRRRGSHRRIRSFRPPGRCCCRAIRRKQTSCSADAACRKSSLPARPRHRALHQHAARSCRGRSRQTPVGIAARSPRAVGGHAGPRAYAAQSRAGVERLEKGQPLFHSIVVFENFDLDELMRARGGAWAGRRGRPVREDEFSRYGRRVSRAERLRLKIEFARSSSASRRSSECWDTCVPCWCSLPPSPRRSSRIP